jgi:hypothetical protein
MICSGDRSRLRSVVAAHFWRRIGALPVYFGIVLALLRWTAGCDTSSSEPSSVPSEAGASDGPGDELLQDVAPRDGAAEGARTDVPPERDSGKAECDAAEPTEPGLVGGRVREDRLGPPCPKSPDGFPAPCPDGMTCAGFSHGATGLRCVRGSPCDALACTDCEVCSFTDQSPPMYSCRAR